MDLALFLSALMLGLAGAPHCAAMCGAACAAIAPADRPGAQTAFHLARVAGYALAGAVAASSVGALAALGQWSPALRPLWTLAHAAALGLGLWLLIRGRQPAWLAQIGRNTRSLPAAGWQRVQGPARAAAAGGVWAAWPCGLLQSALMVSALANSAAAGAAAMAGFAIASAGGLALAPWLWARWGGGAAAAAAPTLAVRGAGALLVLASGWALGHGLWQPLIAWCLA